MEKTTNHLDFYIEYNLEVENVGTNFAREADERLRALTADRTDIVGASVALESIVKVESPYLYQVRIVLYKRPENIAVVEKGPEPMTTLKNALDTIERKVHENREHRSEAHMRKPENLDTIVDDLSPQEVFATYMKDAEPAELMDEGRTQIASRLMVKNGLSQEAAYFAADKILQAAQENLNNTNR